MRNKQQDATPKKRATQEIFLEAFAQHGNVLRACQAAGINRSTVYRWKEHSDKFLLHYNQALEDAKDNIRAEVYRRGHDGVLKPLMSQGQLVYEYEPVLDDEGKPKRDSKGKPMMQRGQQAMIREYSDTLLIFHAKMLMPEYREKGVVINNVLPKEYIGVPEDGIETE